MGGGSPRIINVPYSESLSLPGRYGERTLAAGIRDNKVYIEAEGISLMQEPIAESRT